MVGAVALPTERRLCRNAMSMEVEMTEVKLQELLPEELARLLFAKLVKTYPLVTEEWREKKRTSA